VRLQRALAWSLFFLYALWAAALQGVLASPRQLGEWTPDLGLCFLFAWSARLDGGRGALAAILVALGRASFGADPPVVLAAASLGALGLFAGLRAVLVVDRALPRALLCGACAWLSAEFLLAARSFALAAEEPGESQIALLPARLWPGALLTALACLLLVPVCRRLPGLAPLGRVRP
jgi:cell shape-determining protein MreD